MISSTPPPLCRICRYLFLWVIPVVLFGACSEEYVPEPFEPRNDHEAYYHSLRQAGLTETALGQDWLASSVDALNNPITAETPLEEMLYLDPTRADAVAYRFTSKRGHKVQIEIETLNESAGRLFVDLYRASTDRAAVHVATASADHQIAFEPRQDGVYILRIQSELLRGGSFLARIVKVPAFEFPVAGGHTRDIGSFFGDPRDGGRRKHHGVDIFAPRGTPILAPTDGYIRFTGERGLGGLVVWMRDEQRGQTLYFAHLDEIIARRHGYVQTGDTLGTVGNTGNARTTPPHLHFGIYKNGPIDPYYFVAAADKSPDPVGAESAILAQTMRTARLTTLWPACTGHNRQNIGRHQLLSIRGARKDRLRVLLPDGTMGYVSSDALESTELPLDNHTISKASPLHALPNDRQAPINVLQEGEEVEVLARTKDFLYVRSGLGETGWMPAR